jgi:hypothetical protein
MKELKFNIFIYIFLLVSVIMLAINYVSLQKFFPTWDFLGYHIATDYMINLLKNNFYSFWHHSQQSIKYSEYNVASQLILIPFTYIDTTNRFLFIAALSGVYLPIFFFLVYIFIKNIFNVTNHLYLFLLTLFALFSINILYPTFLGLQDIAVAVSIIAAYIMYFKQHIEQRTIKSILLMAVIIYSGFLFKKSAGFVIFTFIFLTLIYAFFNLLKQQNKKQYIIQIIYKYAVLGITMLILVLIFQKGLFMSIIKPAYGSYYTDWQYDSYYKHFIQFLNLNGWLLIVQAIIGLIFGYFSKYRRIAIFLFLHMVATFLIFTQLQHTGMQHNIQLAAVQLLLLTLLGLIVISNLIHKNYKLIFVIIFVVINIGNYFVSIYYKNSFLVQYKIIPIYSYPYYVNSYNDQKNMLDKINEIFEKNPQRISINAISLDSETIKSYAFYNKKDNLNNYLIRLPVLDTSHQVIYGNIFKVDYMVIESSINFANLHNNEKIIGIINDIFLNNKNIAKAYTKTNFQYTWQTGQSFVMYKKTRKITEQEIKEFLNEVYKYYPEFKNNFDENKIKRFYNEQ